MNILHQVVRSLQLLGCLVKFILAHRNQAADFALHHTHVGNSLNHITCSWLTLGTDHGSTLSNTAERLAQVLGTTNEWHVELSLVDVINIISWREHLALVDIVDFDSLKNLSLSEVTDAALSHYRDRNSLLNTLNHLRVAHTRNTTCCTDVSWNTFQSHYCACTCCLCDSCLFRSCYVHNHTTLEHLSQVAVQFLSIFCHNSYIFIQLRLQRKHFSAK